jgi:hypothetical protein
MNEKVAKEIRRISGFKVHRPRRYYFKDYTIFADQHRELYLKAKQIYLKTHSLPEVVRIITQEKERLGL